MEQDEANLTNDELIERTRILTEEIQEMQMESGALAREMQYKREILEINECLLESYKEKPHRLATVKEVIASDDQDSEGPSTGAIVSIDKSTTFYIRTSGLVASEDLQVGDQVALKPPFASMIESLPGDLDLKARATEVQERPAASFADIVGYQQQIEELREAVILPVEHLDRYHKIGLRPPKGVLLYGPPGTGKTSLARACAGVARCTFLRIAATRLVERFIGDGGKLIRDIFALAKAKAPSILFIDDIDALGLKRTAHKSGGLNTDLSLPELLSCLDDLSSIDTVRVIAATNRLESLDPALVRSGRFDKKIEVPLPDFEARAAILELYARKMVCSEFDLREVARELENWSGAHCRAVCTEAGMVALRRNANCVTVDDFYEAISEVRTKKKKCNYFA